MPSHLRTLAVVVAVVATVAATGAAPLAVAQPTADAKAGANPNAKAGAKRAPTPGIKLKGDPKPEAGGWEGPVKLTGKIDGKVATGTMLVYHPAGYPSGVAETNGADGTRRHPLVIALHGWDHSPEQLRDKGKLESWANRYGLVIAVPAMSTTIYETQLYPESKRTWGPVPGTRWVGEVVLPYLRKRYAVSGERAHTAVIGYSTGGRGAVLLAEAYPEFAFAGSASGTFDLMRLDPKDGEYKIHAVVYGPRDRFKDRWELDNCIAPARLARLAGTRLYIAHGGKDTSVRPDQLDALKDALKDHPEITAEFTVTPDAGHTWPYWVSTWPAMFAALGTALGIPDTWHRPSP